MDTYMCGCLAAVVTIVGALGGPLNCAEPGWNVSYYDIQGVPLDLNNFSPNFDGFTLLATDTVSQVLQPPTCTDERAIDRSNERATDSVCDLCDVLSNHAVAPWTDSSGAPLPFSDNFGVVFNATFQPPETGTYTFRVQSDDAAVVFIDGNVIIIEQITNAFTVLLRGAQLSLRTRKYVAVTNKETNVNVCMCTCVCERAHRPLQAPSSSPTPAESFAQFPLASARAAAAEAAAIALSLSFSS